MRHTAMPTTRTIVIVAYDGVQALDVSGPASVFSGASYRQHGAYEIIIASPRGGAVRGGAGMDIANTIPIAALARRRSAIDTILVAGGDEDGVRSVIEAGDLTAWLRRRAPTVRRVGSVCTGAFVLAAAGLLDGRRAATHWASCGLLASLFPAVQVENDAIFVIDGKVCTSAGVTAGIDLALALVERDLSAPVASMVARDLVLYFRRPGGQAVFASALSAQMEASDRMAGLVAWIMENTDKDLGVAALARRAGMSERNFARVFLRDTGQTPAAFAAGARLDRARQWLETTTWPVSKVAQRAGFGSLDALQRTFRTRLGVTPAEYRERFRPTATPARRL